MDTNTLSNDNSVKKIINNNINYYETCLLAAIICDVKFWKENCLYNINTAKNKFSNYKDFSKPIDNILYDTISDFYKALSVNGLISSGMRVTEEIISNLIQNKLKENLLVIDDSKQIEIRLKEILAIIKNNTIEESILVLINNGFDYWVDLRRTKQVTADNLRQGGSSDDLLLQIKNATSRLKQNKIDNRGIMDVLSEYELDEDDSWERIPIANLAQLTKCMGGGIKKKESMLIIAPSGGGKTTIACQIASGLCLGGCKVVYITTEQPDGELLPKITSCCANIPYEKIKDGFYHTDEFGVKTPILNTEEFEEASKLWKELNGNLFFENWCESGSKIMTDLDNTIEKHKELNNIDVVILDWIGGGITINTNANSEYRMVLREGCRQIKDLAHKYNVAIIGMAQAGTKKSTDVKAINATHIDEFTEMHQYFTWGLGISALGINPKGNFSGEIENKATKQFFNLFKTRKSKSKLYPVITDFDYSRFVEANGVTNIDTSASASNMHRKTIGKLNNSGVFNV